MSKRTFDLADNENSKEFLEKLKKKYPDRNVFLSLEGKSLLVEIDSKIPLQLKLNIFSFISQEIQRGA